MQEDDGSSDPSLPADVEDCVDEAAGDSSAGIELPPDVEHEVPMLLRFAMALFNLVSDLGVYGG